MKKKSSLYATKAIALKMDDVDEATRTVKGMFSAFNIIDSDSDVIRRGAFAKSIAERGPNSASNRKIAHLWMHDLFTPIGRLKELYETEEGLVFVSVLGNSTAGMDALHNYKDGIINEHSIGFRYVADKMEYIEPDKAGGEFGEGGYFNITEVNLFEGSAVVFGANEFTPTLEVAKGEQMGAAIEKLNKEMKSLSDAIRNGKGTDERLAMLDIWALQVAQKYNALIEQSQQPPKALPDVIEPQASKGESPLFYYL